MKVAQLNLLLMGIHKHLLINLKEIFFDMAVGTSPNLARMCG